MRQGPPTRLVAVSHGAVPIDRTGTLATFGPSALLYNAAFSVVLSHVAFIAVLHHVAFIAVVCHTMTRAGSYIQILIAYSAN